MKKNAYTLVELLSVIVILAVISAIAIPKVIDTIGISKLSAYNSAKGNIVESAKLKYLADVNDSKITEYTVDDLIDAGYLKKDTKNPITNEKYENTKILITNDDGTITYDYIEGNTLYDIVSGLNSDDGVYKDNDTYLFKGIDSNNYIYFNKEIYRILKVDSYRNIYIIKDEDKTNINFDNIDIYKRSYYNDNYQEKARESILSFEILNYNDYVNSFLDGESFIENNSDVWVKLNNKYSVLSYLTNQITNNNAANSRFVLKLKSSVIISSGDGSQLNPYILN